MSQAGIISLSTTPLPPDVPLSFGTDFDSMGAPPGTVVATNNKIYVLGNNGIVTYAQTTDATDDTVQVAFAGGTATTSDGAGQTQTIITFSTIANTSFVIQVLLVARDTVTDDAFGGRLVIVCKNVAGTVSISGELENISTGDASLLSPSACSFSAAPSGSLININVIGITGKTIDWAAITPGTLGV